MSRENGGRPQEPDRRESRQPSWKDVTQHWLGRVSLPCLPDSYVAKLIDDYYIDQEPDSFLKQSVRAELTRRYYERPEAERRASNRDLFWGATAGIRWHEERRRRYQDRRLFHDEYLKSRRRMLEQMNWLLEHFPFVNNLCEIGTGNGMLVNYLAGQFRQVERFQGIDLSAEQISRNKRIYGESKVEFLHVEATDYVVNHCRPGTLLVACGTFECFSQAELEEFLALTKKTVDRVALATCDAMDVDFDVDSERNSRPRGNLLYNHSYRYLLEKHGYKTCFHQVEYPKPIYNRLSILATSFPCPDVRPRSRTSN